MSSLRSRRAYFSPAATVALRDYKESASLITAATSDRSRIWTDR
jgi:hypothetical protein